MYTEIYEVIRAELNSTNEVQLQWKQYHAVHDGLIKRAKIRDSTNAHAGFHWYPEYTPC